MAYKGYIHVIFTLIIMVAVFLISGLFIDRGVTVYVENSPLSAMHTVIIDAGHGGVDGGATSSSGVLESKLNLEICLRLDDLMHLLGIRTKMIRTEDISVYTEGESIAAKKVSDLKERVRIVNNTDNTLLISIHQNYYADPYYSGAQVFYGTGQGSDTLAKDLQTNFVKLLNPGSNRLSKKSDGIYLLKNVNCPAVLIECGFLSNPQEDQKLQNPNYQKQLCCVIAGVCSQYLNSAEVA